jgi:hypothetical protein
MAMAREAVEWDTAALEQWPSSSHFLEMATVPISDVSRGFYRLWNMDPLRKAPSCALDETGLGVQLGRYRRAGEDARLIERTRRRLVVIIDEHVENALIEKAVITERACCPFFMLSWEAHRRRLTVAVSEPEHEPALEGIAFALGLETSAASD